MVTAYLLIITRPNKLKIVSAALAKCEEIKEIHEVYGRYDIIAKVEVEVFDDFHTFFQNNISIIEGIRKTETIISMGGKVNNNHNNDDNPQEDESEPEDNTESDEVPTEEDVEFKV